MVTNPKIERKKADIAKTMEKLANVKARLREQKQDLLDLENEEIVAMFRKEIITEDDLKSLMRSRLDVESGADDDLQEELIEPVRERGEEQT
jgi:hypothetical protein